MPDTERTFADLIARWGPIPGIAAHLSNRQLMRDTILSLDYYPTLVAEVGVVSERYNYGDIRRFGAATAASAAANTTAINNALTSGINPVNVPSGTFHVNDEFNPPNGTEIRLSAGTVIIQDTVGKGVWATTNRSNVWIHYQGGSIMGPGVWSNGWTGVAGHEERGEKWYGCTNCGSTFANIKNFGLAGWAILGGSHITMLCPKVEGTHVLGSLLHQGDSFQFVGLIQHDVTYGACSNILVQSPEGFNTAMGINTVDNVAFGGSLGLIDIPNANMHDIIGQHGAYISTSNTLLPNFNAKNCGLDGIKLFSGVANEVLRGIVLEGFRISDCTLGQAVEIGISGTGRIYNCRVTGVAENCARALTVDGDARHCKAVIQSFNMSQRALNVAQGSGIGPTDCVWEIESDTTGDKGALIAASTSDRNLLKFKGRRPGAGQWLISVTGCAGLTIESPDCRDDLGNMLYGIYCEAGASNVKFTGTPLIYGYSNSAIRCDAPTSGIQAQWLASPGDFTLLKTAFGANQGNNIVPKAPMLLGRQTTVAGFVPIWQLTLDDESTYHITAKLIGKLAGSAERKSVELRATYWRDAAGVATIQGAVTTLHTQASAGFTGTFDMATPTVNDVRLLVNSASAITIDWVAEITVLKISP